MNKSECGMSVLDFPLAHEAIMRGDMALWAEKATQGVNSMATLCTIAANFDKARDKALAWIPSLQEKVKTALIVENIGTKIRAAVNWMMVDATEQLGVNQAS